MFHYTTAWGVGPCSPSGNLFCNYRDVFEAEMASYMTDAKEAVKKPNAGKPAAAAKASPT